MTVMVFAGSALEDLSYAVLEHFNPGQKVEILLGLSENLSDQQLADLEAELTRQGVWLFSPAEIGTGPWPVTLRLVVERLPRPSGVAAWPLVVLIIGALGAVGMTGILGWRVGEAVESIGQSIARSLIPLTLVVGGIWIFSKYVGAR